MAKLTPMMKQYKEIKDRHKDCIIFYRLGDFYEMFFDDALTASRELEITLTARNCGLEEKAPMCGVPHHSAENYINKLIDKGYKVAICEQVEDVNASKGIVKRDVVRIVTPGTIINQDVLDENSNNYIMSITQDEKKFGISVLDITTGEYKVTEVKGETKLYDEVAKYNPAEILISPKFSEKIKDFLKDRFNSFINILEEWRFEYEKSEKDLCSHFDIHSLSGFGLEEYYEGVKASGALLSYVKETQKVNLSHISELNPYLADEFMMLDISSRRNLELTETLREKEKKGSLLWVLDKTKTAMGGRTLKRWITQPLLKVDDIKRRLDATENLKEKSMIKADLREFLNTIYDIERLMSKVIYLNANARDMIALRDSLEMLPHIKNLLSHLDTEYLKEIYEKFDTLEDIFKLISKAIKEDPPVSITEGDIINDGFNEDIDNYRKAKKEGKNWLAELETKEKEKTGIKSLKIKHNKIFGYYIEVTKSYYDLVPDRYTRKQTMANSERYIIPELKKIENQVLGAEEKLENLEHEIFTQVRKEIGSHINRIQDTAKKIAILDAIQSLAHVADKSDYCKPKITNKQSINITDGRHPVVEKMMNERFIPNNTFFDKDEERVCIITGPNMAGKSTYMRQVALITLMAQIGSFVPCKEAEIGVVDRIFTRVGASDDLASGKSTFMVEMSEVSNILHNATKRSLLILDEIGRGTSTFDGLSIAWAVVEYISNEINAKTLFATHYHELTELEGRLDGVKNYMIDAKEKNDDIIFLRKIKRGGANNSYGIQVAKLAGLPKNVINRSKIILSELNKADITKHTKNISEINMKQLSLMDEEGKYDAIIEEIENIDVMNLTPMDSLKKIEELKKNIKKIN